MSMIENFNFERFLYSLQYMWQGMLSIFLVIGVIVSLVAVLNRLGNKTKNQEK